MDFDRQYDRIYRFCYFKVHDRELAEDITQEAFLRFLQNKNYSGKGHDLQILYTIAKNLCTDEFRKRRVYSLDEYLADRAEKGAWDDIVLKMSVKNALDSLDENDRELLLLYYVNEVPLSVISRIYGITRFSLYRRLKRIKAGLKNLLGEEEMQ